MIDFWIELENGTEVEGNTLTLQNSRDIEKGENIGKKSAGKILQTTTTIGVERGRRYPRERERGGREREGERDILHLHVFSLSLFFFFEIFIGGMFILFFLRFFFFFFFFFFSFFFFSVLFCSHLLRPVHIRFGFKRSGGP